MRRSSRRPVSAILATIVATGLAALAAAAGPVQAMRATPVAAGADSSTLTPRLLDVAAAAPARTSATDASPSERRRTAEAIAAQNDQTADLTWRRDGRLVVEVRLFQPLDEQSSGQVGQLGAHIVGMDPSGQTMSVAVFPDDLVALGKVRGVRAVLDVQRPMTRAACPTGTVSEGDAQLGTDSARRDYGVDGAGVTVGVISDSFNTAAGVATTAADDVINGDLPGPGNPCGRTIPVEVQNDDDGADEGRAMAQIVHDLAPGAKIRTATPGLRGEPGFAADIRALAVAGADVIVDDLVYFAEPMYQDGLVAQAVEDVTAAGVTYVSAAGNETWFSGSDNVSSYETTAYRPATCPAAVIAAFTTPPVDCHDFDPGSGVDTGWGATRLSGQARYILGWNEPQNAVQTDLNFALVDRSTGAVALTSRENNVTTGRTFEILTFSSVSQFDLVVARRSATATPRFKFVSFRSQVGAVERPLSAGGDIVGPTIFGHSAARSAIGVGAIPYNNANTIETFSSRGPTTLCWTGVTSTPAVALPSCVSTTVDLSATDGTANSFFGSFLGGFYRFYGTSAAAPHAAAAAALIRQAAPCLSPAQVKSVMKTTAAQIAGFDTNAQGAGRLQTRQAIAAARNLCASTRGLPPAAAAASSRVRSSARSASSPTGNRTDAPSAASPYR